MIDQKFASPGPQFRLAYLEQGEPDGPPVIFLHGLSDSAGSYLPLMVEFPQSFRLIAVTQRGHGDSDKPAEGYETSRFADDLAGFMDALDIPRAVIVGHSFGTVVALRFALDHPDRVSGLGLLGGFRTLAGHPGLREILDEVSHASGAIDPEFVRAFQESTLARPIPAERLESAIAESKKMPVRVWKALTRYLLDDDFSGEYARIAAPALVLWGEQDAFTGRDEQEGLASALRNAQLIAVPEGGHALHWEDPAGTARVLGQFCAGRIDAAA